VEEESTYIDEELREIEEQEFSLIFQELKGNINEANALAIKLPNYPWPGWMGDVGLITEPSGREFTNVKEILLDELKVYSEAVLEQCQRCKTCSSQVWSSNPYKESQVVVGEIEMVVIEQWYETLHGFENDLYTTIDPIEKLQIQSSTLFHFLEGKLSEAEWAGENYLLKFSTSTQKYSDLLLQIRHNINKSKEIVSQLTSWEFKSLSVSKMLIK